MAEPGFELAFDYDLAIASAKRWEQRRAAREENLRYAAQGKWTEVDPREHLAKVLNRRISWLKQAVTETSELPEPLMELVLAPEIRPEQVDDRLTQQIIGATRDLLGTRFFQAGLSASRAVARVISQQPDGHRRLGTGFMVTPKLLITTHHVLPSANVARASAIEFGFEIESRLANQPTERFGLAPDAFFLSDPENDFSLVAVAATSERGVPLGTFGYCPLIGADGKIANTEWVNIIQHASGDLKQIAIRNNRLIDMPGAEDGALFEKYAYYDAVTDPGSAGSPVFNDSWEVVALHHASVPRCDSAGNILDLGGAKWSRDADPGRIAWIGNEGIRVSKIVEHVGDVALQGSANKLRDEFIAIAEGAAHQVPHPWNVTQAMKAALPKSVVWPSSTRGLAGLEILPELSNPEASNLEAIIAPPSGLEGGEPVFHFKLEGEAYCDQVVWGAAFDLLFNYEVPTDAPLGIVGGEAFEAALKKSVELEITVTPRGFFLADGVKTRVARFENNKLVSDPPRFRFKAPAKDTPVPEGGFGINMSFKIGRAEFDQFFLQLRPVETLSMQPCPPQRFEVNPSDLADVKLEPRVAEITIETYQGNWRIHWRIDGLDGAARDTTKVNQAQLEKEYEAAGIIADLNRVAVNGMWKSVDGTLKVSDEMKEEARACMEKSMAAGWKLYRRLQQDELFREMFEEVEKLPGGSKITIKTDQQVFPWELLYPDKVLAANAENADPGRFWGARFLIESVPIALRNAPRPPLRRRQSGPLHISMALNESIDAEWKARGGLQPVQLQKDYCDGVLKPRGVYVSEYSAITRIFTEPHSASMIYCFCHGTDRKLEFDKTREPITADDITEHVYEGWPIVFLNACSAAAISPLLLYGFREVFRQKRAFGVIAPSFQVPTLFAAIFAKELISRYKDGAQSIGECLFDLRRELLDQGIPLGLWYSLQCPFDVKAPVSGG